MTTRNQFLIGAIVLLTALIIGQVVLLADRRSASESYQSEVAAKEQQRRDILALGEDDYVYGERGADVVLVTYADTECPFCKTLHFKIANLVDELNGEGVSVARVHRHAPLGIWDKSVREARAAECVGAESGSAGYYGFLDALYEATPSNNGLDLSLLPDLARQAGATDDVFAECMESQRYQERIVDQKLDATILGVTAIPHTFIVGSRAVFEVVGNKPRETFEFLISEARQ